MIDTEKVIAAAAAEIDKLDERGVHIVVDAPIARMVRIIGLLQLSMQHPELPEDAKASARQFCDTMIELIGRVSPLLADFCKLGFFEERGL